MDDIKKLGDKIHRELFVQGGTVVDIENYPIGQWLRDETWDEGETPINLAMKRMRHFDRPHIVFYCGSSMGKSESTLDILSRLAFEGQVYILHRPTSYGKDGVVHEFKHYPFLGEQTISEIKKDWSMSIDPNADAQTNELRDRQLEFYSQLVVDESSRMVQEDWNQLIGDYIGGVVRSQVSKPTHQPPFYSADWRAKRRGKK